jgi:MFS family permease
MRRILGRDVPASISLPVVAGVILMDTATWFTFGGIGILIVVIAVDVFHGGDAATGYLNAALGVGGTIGALLSGALVLRPKLGPVLIAGGFVLGIATIALGLSNVIGVAFVAIAVASAGNLILDVSRTTILQRAVPDAFRGRVNGLLYTTQSVSESSGTLIIPILVTVFGFGIVMGVAGVAVIVATVGAVLLIAGAADVAPGPYDAELRRIARLPLFGGLSPARVEGALLGLTARTVAAGEVVIRQGEPADRFFIIESGAFEVTQTAESDGGIRRLRTLGPDEVFGERGILAKTPRSATVTATTDGLVFAMDGDAFLRLVGARGAVADRMLALYDTPVAEVAARS